ncbi:MAG TPA: dihydroorotate dehydrogenase electron transfer subunit, partial [Clostridiales bacterium UBA8153]|nr:dihydroorotate dehydrogenase electron transfer subunit [Clostridiales bacterium UBA8153]
WVLTTYTLAPQLATVLENRAIAPGHHRLRLLAPDCARQSRPGQFIHVKVTGGTTPLLRRPISIALAYPSTGEIALLVREAGAGTQYLCSLRVGDRADLMGPLGQGFPVIPAGSRLLLAGGGIGVAPLLAAAQEATAHGTEVTACVGARRKELLVGVEELEGLGARVLPATDDGSRGYAGPVTGLVQHELSTGRYRLLFGCGPVGMLCALQELARRHTADTYLSLEQYMACGVGACLGCAVKAADAGGYLKVCRDGPVFAAGRVVLEGLPGGGGCVG